MKPILNRTLNARASCIVPDRTAFLSAASFYFKHCGTRNIRGGRISCRMGCSNDDSRINWSHGTVEGSLYNFCIVVIQATIDY
jgi:hypothetical protein